MSVQDRALGGRRHLPHDRISARYWLATTLTAVSHQTLTKVRGGGLAASVGPNVPTNQEKGALRGLDPEPNAGLL